MRDLIERLFSRKPEALTHGLWAGVRANVRWFAALDDARDQRLQRLVEQFLHEKTITGVAGLSLDQHQRTTLAGLCCLPLLEFGAEGMHGWSQVIVYPDAFRTHHSHLDAAGVMHEWEDDLIGEAWDQGPLILSWADIEADIAEPDAGFNVAVHEMAHTLDALDGVLDGTPALPRQWQREWAHDFQRSFDAFVAQVEAGVDTGLDAYAAEAPEEFFAVCSEYHFSDPHRLRRALPLVARHLDRFYGPSPMA